MEGLYEIIVSDDNNECSICTGSVTSMEKAVTECKHMFCREDIDKWIETEAQKNKTLYPRCPMCRAFLKFYVVVDKETDSGFRIVNILGQESDEEEDHDDGFNVFRYVEFAVGQWPRDRLPPGQGQRQVQMVEYQNVANDDDDEEEEEEQEEDEEEEEPDRQQQQAQNMRNINDHNIFNDLQGLMAAHALQQRVNNQMMHFQNALLQHSEQVATTYPRRREQAMLGETLSNARFRQRQRELAERAQEQVRRIRQNAENIRRDIHRARASRTTNGDASMVAAHSNAAATPTTPNRLQATRVRPVTRSTSRAFDNN
jgi:hypothetical protein